MGIKEKDIVDIIKNYVGYTDRSGTDQCLHEVNFDLVAKEIVKKITKVDETKTAEKFICYEMHTWSRSDGCGKQCKDCKDVEKIMRKL